MILVVEPVFPNAQHAPCNAGMLRAIRLAAGHAPVTFAAHPAHRAAVFDILGEVACTGIAARDIAVLPAGGISLRRFRSQAATLFRLVRQTRPGCLVCLGTQPETLFALRLLRAVHRDLRVVAVLHGNLHLAAAGWRSRDPRRRWFDDRAALRAAIGARGIDFVVLDGSVRTAALALGLLPPARTHVWPEVITDPPLGGPPRRPDKQRLRIAFLGAAKHAKGFADFAAITRRLAARGGYEFSLVGALQDQFPAEDLAHIDIPAGFLDRPDFLARLARVDYICLPLREDTYTLTVSGALLDAIAALKPLLALPTPAIRDLFRHGPAGFLCDDLAAMEAVLGEPDRLADPVLYDQFRANLARERSLRSPQSLALAVRPLIAGPVVQSADAPPVGRAGA